MSDFHQNQGGNFQHAPQRILIRTPNWLGDLMMSVAFIQRVLSKFPASTVDLVVKQGFQEIPLPHRGEVLVFENKFGSVFNFGKFLRTRKYDRIYILPPSFSSALMAFVAKIPVRIGYHGHFRSLLLNVPKTYKQRHRSEHIIKEYLRLLEDPITEDSLWPRLELSQKWIGGKIADFEIDEQTICLAPGAIYGPAKQWPIDHFRKVATVLATKGQNVVILGTQSDHSAGEIIRADNPGVTNLCGKTDLPQFIALLAISKMLISNDSGSMHIMAALQKPQIAIFGSTSHIWTGPMNKRARIVSIDLPCSPCFSRVCPKQHYDCLRGVSPDRVLEQVQDFFKITIVDLP